MDSTLPPTYAQRRRSGEATLANLLQFLSGVLGSPPDSNLAELSIYSFIP
jgi:hypothetical protein